MSSLQEFFIKKPKLLLLIDGIGAFYTASMLLIIKNVFISYIGLPTNLFDYLVVMACCMGIFSIAASMLVKKDVYKYLRAIALVNLMYCIITIGIVFLNHQRLMVWGFAYFLIEVLVIVSLSIVELRVSQTLNSINS